MKAFAQTNTSKTLNKEKMEISQIKITPDAYEPFRLALKLKPLPL